MLRKVLIYDCNYISWKWFDAFTLEQVECDLEPLNLKLFKDDVI